VIGPVLPLAFFLNLVKNGSRRQSSPAKVTIEKNMKSYRAAYYFWFYFSPPGRGAGDGL
jgi:hypothetical protein